MLTPRHPVLPVAISLTCGLSATVLMFTLPGDAAAPPQLTYSSSASGEVLRINKLDLDMSGDAQSLDLAVGRVSGVTGATGTPRSLAGAANLVGNPQPAGQKAASSGAADGSDTTGTTTATGTAGSIAQQLDYRASTLTARARWAGDSSCVAVTTPLTTSRSIGQGASIPPAVIPVGEAGLPIPVPTDIPTEIPTAPPSDFPTGLPTDLPSPTIPTSPPTTLPPLPTDTLPTTLPPLPSVPTGLPRLLPAATGSRADGPVSMAGAAAATNEEKTSLLDFGASGLKKVQSEVTATLATPTAPAMTFFGGEVELRLASAPRLTAYSTGTSNGSQVEWAPPTMTLRVGGEDYSVPTDGKALAVPYSKNKDVVLTVSAGTLSAAESADGTLAQAAVTTLDVLIKNGTDVVLDADLFPLAVRATAPANGVTCPAPTVDPVSPRLKLGGKDNGPRADRLTINAAPIASGARATVFATTNKKKLKKAGSGRLDKHGDRVFKVKDTNGKKATKYLVKLSATDLTTGARATRRIR